MYAWQFAKAQAVAREHGWTQFVSMQNHYNLVYREEERETIPLCVAEGVGCVPWSPLARGFLSGSRRRGEPAETARARSDEFADKLYFRGEDFDVLDALLEVARGRDLPPARLALAWLLSRPGVVAPIIGATKLAHLEEAVAALEVKLSDEEIAKLEAPYKPHPVLGHDQPTPRDAGCR